MSKLITDKEKIRQVLTRGVEQILPDLDQLIKLMSQRRIKIYLGIDPTGSLLTLGHGVVLRKLQQLANLGHQVILLIGNGTVKIGDPTGKDSTRPELTEAQIEANFRHWRQQASKILDFSTIEIRHNGDWLDQMKMPDVIKLMAKITVQQLMERDMFQARLKKNLPIHGHEIMYPMLQGYDSVAMDVDLEIGGSDQLFNMMMGRQLQKIYHNKEKWVLTTPIIAGLDGRKMSKSYGNFIALTEDYLHMYAKLMRLNDEQISIYFQLLTDIPLSEIDQMTKAMAAGTNPMEFKKKLAWTITATYHRPALADKAAKYWQNTVQDKQAPDNIITIDIRTDDHRLISICRSCLPQYSSSQLKRLIQQGGVTLLPSDQKPIDINHLVDLSQVKTIKIGKKHWFNLKQIS